MADEVLPTPDKKTAVGVSDGRMEYFTGAESGHTEIHLPALPGSPNQTERLLSKDFGAVVVSRVQSSMSSPGYMTSGPQQSPVGVLRHYLGCAKGAGLLDQPSTTQMDNLIRSMAEAKDPEKVFKEDVRPFLLSLQPRRR